MAVYTFSTQDQRRPNDKEVVEAIKKHCDKNKLNFSLVVIDLLRKHLDEVNNGRQC